MEAGDTRFRPNLAYAIAGAAIEADTRALIVFNLSRMAPKRWPDEIETIAQYRRPARMGDDF